MRNIFGVLKISLSGIFILLISTQTFAACEAELNEYEKAFKNSNAGPGSSRAKETQNFQENAYRSGNFDDADARLRALEIKKKNLRDAIAAKDFGSGSKNSVIKYSQYDLCVYEYLESIAQSQSNNSKQSQSNNSSQSQNQSQPSESQQAQQIQQTMQQAQQQAQQNQQRADQVREGKRKTHDAGAEAHDCIEVDTKSLYGGFKNKCSYPVSYGYCVNNPRKGALTDSPLFSCAGMAARKPFAGAQTIRANGYDANHTKGGDSIYYFACKQPASAMDLTVVIGQGIQGRCGTIGGN